MKSEVRQTDRQTDRQQISVLHFGGHVLNYSRNKLLVSGLISNDCLVYECHTNKSGFRAFFDLFKKRREFFDKKIDFILVSFLGQKFIFLAKIFFPRIPIVFDVLSSLYDSNIIDRRSHSEKSLRSFYFFYLDKLSFLLSDLVLLDTDQQIKYLSVLFGIKKTKFVKSYVGSNEKIFFPIKNQVGEDKNYFLVHFHGSFVPLQGIIHIVKAFELLKSLPIKLNLIGKGPGFEQIKNYIVMHNISNINLFGHGVSYEELNKYINSSDLCLGIFGDSTRTHRVIPNKVFEGIACCKPVLTLKTEAIKELFSDNKNIFLTETNKPEEIARKIIFIKDNLTLRNEVSRNGYFLFLENLNSLHITKKIKDAMIPLLNYEYNNYNSQK